MAEDKRSECWWVVLADGTVLRGDHGGGVALLAEMWLTRPAAYLLRALRLSALVDVLDAAVARYRKRLGRFVPEGPAPRRFP